MGLYTYIDMNIWYMCKYNNFQQILAQSDQGVFPSTLRRNPPFTQGKFINAYNCVQIYKYTTFCLDVYCI